MKTDPLNLNVMRREQDLVALRKIFVKSYPHVIIPPLPSKINQTSPEQLSFKQAFYSRFLNQVLASPDLSRLPLFFNFLRETDTKAIQKELKNYNISEPFPQIPTHDGQAQVNATAKGQLIADKLPDIVDAYQLLNQNLVDLSREALQKQKELSCIYKSIGDNMTHLEELYEKLGSQSNAYVQFKLSTCFLEQAKFQKDLGLLTEEMNSKWLQYNVKEASSMRVLNKNKEALKSQVAKFSKLLLDKKERLFKQKDVTKWGGEDSVQLERQKEQLLQNKELAFEQMLLLESHALTDKQQELHFYENQCASELKRMLKQNAGLHLEHYTQKSADMCRLISET